MTYKDETRETGNGAIPRHHEVYCGEGVKPPAEVPDSLRQPVSAKSPARWAYERLVVYLKNFEEQLNADQEVATVDCYTCCICTAGPASSLRLDRLRLRD